MLAQFLDKVVLPFVVQDKVVQAVQKPVMFPHAFLDMVVDISVVMQRQFPWAWLFSRP